MEVLFQNVHKRTRELYKEIYSYLCFKRPIVIILDIIAALYFIFLISKGEPIFIMLLLIPMIQVIMYIKYTSMSLKRDEDMSADGYVSVDIAVYDNFIEYKLSIGTYVQIKYDNIKKIKQLKNYTLLTTKNNVIYTFKNDGFTKGDLTSFIEFLRIKGVKI